MGNLQTVQSLKEFPTKKEGKTLQLGTIEYILLAVSYLGQTHLCHYISGPETFGIKSFQPKLFGPKKVGQSDTENIKIPAISW